HGGKQGPVRQKERHVAGGRAPPARDQPRLALGRADVHALRVVQALAAADEVAARHQRSRLRYTSSTLGNAEACCPSTMSALRPATTWPCAFAPILNGGLADSGANSCTAVT